MLQTIAHLQRNRLLSKLSSASWKTFSYLGSAQLLITVIGIMSSVLWARFISRETYAQYQLTSSIIDITASFCLSGLGQSLSLSAAKGLYGNFNPIIYLRFLATGLGSVVLIFTAFWVYSDQPAILHGLLIAALIFPLYELQTVWPAWLLGQNHLRLLSKLKVTRRCLSICLLAIFILVGWVNLELLLAGVLGTTAIFSLIVVLHIYKTNQVKEKIKDTEIIKYGFHATAASLLGTLILSDKIIINKYLSIEDVGVYAIALIFPSQIKILNSIFKQMIEPHISAAKTIEEAWLYLKPKIGILMGIFVSLSVLGFFALPTLVPLLFSEKYAASVPYAKWLWLCLGIAAPFVYFGNILIVQQKKTFLYYNSSCYPLVLFGLFLLLIPRYGLWGAIGAQALASFVLTIGYLIAFKWYLYRERSMQNGNAV